MLPGLNFTVIDSNEMDSEAALARLVGEYRATRKTIMIPWVVVYEQAKGREEWFYALHERFRVCPDAFVWAKSSIELHQEERRVHRRLRSIEDRNKTLRIRRILSAPGVLARFLDLPRTRSLGAAVLRLASPPRSLETLMRAISCPPDELKVLRRELQANDRGTLRAAMVRVFREYARQFLRSVGHRKDEARRLSLYPSFSSLTFLVQSFQAMRWHVRPPSKENLADQAWLDREAADMETLLISLYGLGLVTRDGRLLEMREDVVEVVKALW